MELDPWHIVSALIVCLGVVGSGMGALALYTWNGEVKHREAHAVRLLDHSDRIVRLEASAITKTDLREMEQRIMDALTGMDRHQTAAIARVEQVATRAHERADELRRDISGA